MPYHIEPKTIIDGTLYTLLIFSVATWTVILFKIWEFTSNSFRNRRFNSAFWDAANLAQAEAMPKDTAIGPQARIAQKGFSWLNESQNADGKQLKYIGTPDELLEHALLVQMQKEQHLMESGLTLLASIG
ncbi:MAG: MotA/TolQ/ExbB proton channel family protein, partial [Methylobacter sp.]|nr:MotA/TolQ/ExbB proton channel family protein [Methylobacter sp.]